MLNRQNFEIADLAAIDESRSALCGLYVAHDRTCVTDGHLAVVVSSETGVQPSLFDGMDGVAAVDFFSPFVLDRESALRVAKAIPKNTEGFLPAQYAVVDGTTENSRDATVSVNDLFRQEILRARKVTGDFPSIDRVVPEKFDARFTITFSAELLLDIVKAANRFCKGRGSASVDLRLYGAGKPLRIDAGDAEQSFTAILMPLRNDGDTEDQPE